MRLQLLQCCNSLDNVNPFTQLKLQRSRLFQLRVSNTQVAYHNYTAFNLIGQESLRDLNERLPEKRGKVTMDQFRPNFVITGCPAYDEVSPRNCGNTCPQHTHTRTHARTHARARTHTHTRTHARARAHTHTCTHARAHTHTHTHTHTNTHRVRKTGRPAITIDIAPSECSGLVVHIKELSLDR